MIAYLRAHPPRRSGDLGETTRAILLLRSAGLAPTIGDRDLVRELLAKRRALGLLRQPRQHDRLRDLRPARGGAVDAQPRRPHRRALDRRPGQPGRRLQLRRPRRPARGSTTPARRCRGSSRPGAAARKTVRRAARFLARRQNPDGGYPLQPGGPSNAQSTAWAVQALVAAGRNPDRQRRNGARSPVAYLRSLVTPSGAVRYSRTSAQTPVWVTAQALAALARKPFPLAPVARRKAAAATPKPAGASPRPRPLRPAAPAGKPPAGKPPAASRKPAGRQARRVRTATPQGDFAGLRRPPTLAPTLQSQAHLAGYLVGTLL